MPLWLLYALGSVVLWSIISILDSHLVQKYSKDPFILSWNQSYWSLLILGAIAATNDVGTMFVVPLLAVGCISYIGDLIYWKVLSIVDASAMSIAWSLHAICMGIAGYFFFQEIPTVFQGIGAALVISGVGILSRFGKKKILTLHSVALLTLIAIVFLPFYVGQKFAFLSGAPLLTIFFWPLLGREGMNCMVPMVVPRLRSRILGYMPQMTTSFVVTAALVILVFFTAMLLSTLAVQEGPVSLISVVANIQPFIVLSLVWMCRRWLPYLSPKEILQQDSLAVKLLSYLLVFGGLALIALSQ